MNVMKFTFTKNLINFKNAHITIIRNIELNIQFIKKNCGLPILFCPHRFMCDFPFIIDYILQYIFSHTFLIYFD